MAKRDSCVFSCRFRLKSGCPYRRRVLCRLDGRGFSVRQGGGLVCRVSREDVSEFGYGDGSFYVRTSDEEYRMSCIRFWKFRDVCRVLDSWYGIGGRGPDGRDFGF